MSAFLTDLVTREARNTDDGNYVVAEVLSYQSDLVASLKLPNFPDGVINVPVGTVTDLASVPRFPLIYLLAGGTSNEAAVIHDYLYQTHLFDRATSDAILREASEATGVPAWRRWMMWAGVRAGGWTHWGKFETAGKTVPPPQELF